MGAEGQVQLPATPLCTINLNLGPTQPIATPWRSRRLTALTGGSFEGPRLRGEILPFGADWAEQGPGQAEDGVRLSLDVRSLWKTDDGALVHVAYTGRLKIPSAILTEFRDPAAIDQVDEDSYYFRIQPTFETDARAYDWLNDVAAVGFGRRTSSGVRYRVFALD